MRRTVKTPNKTHPVIWQFQVLGRGLLPFWGSTNCFCASIARATYISRPTGGDAGIIREALRPVREKLALIKTTCALPCIVQVLQAPHVAELIADDLQFKQITCRTPSCSRSGGTRVLLRSRRYHRDFHTLASTSCQLGIIWTLRV